MNSYFIPHAGYHWDGVTDRFFEGWYFRVALPEFRDGFAFMYSIQDPSGDRVNSGGAVQILAPGDRYLYRTFPDTRKFWATRHGLGLGHWGKTSVKSRPRYLNLEEFENSIREGYQATLTHHRGRIHDPVTGRICQWSYSVEPIYTWGSPLRPPKATAGLLSYLPIADPGWQIVLASAVATGYIDWMGDRYEFHRAPFYSEKNWGYSFPDRWFWINSNAFPEHRDLTVTAVGSTRKLFGFTESVGIIGIHHLDRFYEFVPWNSRIRWRVDTWGSWEMSAENEGYRVSLVGKTAHPPASVCVPTENGLAFRCLDTLRGDLSLKLEDYRGRPVLESRTSLAGLEIGGIWSDSWQNDG